MDPRLRPYVIVGARPGNEGAALAGLVSGRLAEIARLTGQASGTAVLQPAALRGRLRQMVSDLLDLTQVMDTRKLAEAVRGTYVPDERIRLVLNRMGRHNRLRLETVVELLGPPFAQVPYDEVVPQAANTRVVTARSKTWNCWLVSTASSSIRSWAA